MTQKQPQAGEWWTCKGTRVRIVGLHSGGDYVCELNDGSLSLLSIGEWWHYLPDCTGWDWQPEVYPQYWTTLYVASDVAYVVRENGGEFGGWYCVMETGKSLRKLMSCTWSSEGRTQITKEEAQALVKPQESPDDWQPEVWPKYYLGERWSDVDAYVRFDDAESLAVWVATDGSEKRHKGHVYSNVETSKQDHRWREITEAEALARVKPPETFPQYWTALNDITFAYCERFEPNKYRMVERDGTVMPDSPWYPDSDRDRKQITKEEAEALVKPQESPYDWVEITDPNRTQITKEEAEALVKPQESPYDWVEITDPNHVRRACDFVAGKTCHPDKWVTCRATIGFSQSAWPESKIRCRRKDLPVMPSLVESPDDWVEIDVGVISKPRINIDWMQHKTDKTAGYSDWGPAMVFWTTEIWERHKQDWKVRCRRKDLPVTTDDSLAELDTQDDGHLNSYGSWNE